NEIHVAKVEHNYKMVKETILKACEEIKNISSFDIQDRLKLGNFSETVTLDDESYHRCYDASNSYVYYYENTKSISTEEPIAIIVTIITIFALLNFFTIITKMIKRNRKFCYFRTNHYSSRTQYTPSTLLDMAKNFIRGENLQHRPLNNNGDELC
ncbi:hypothetical protein, partial [Candidatus Ichthyocystis sparus]|uniref:hypothetical protein n=1 Tax=Candidatus Ichthyocystis sparus TaxID=1561004 RepID=UPI001F5F5813